MWKSYLELQSLEEKKIKEYIRQIEGANTYYKKLTIYKSLAIVFFILNLLIILSCVFEYIIINKLLISFIIVMCSSISLILLFLSNFYKRKTLISLEKYYNSI